MNAGLRKMLIGMAAGAFGLAAVGCNKTQDAAAETGDTAVTEGGEAAKETIDETVGGESEGGEGSTEGDKGEGSCGSGSCGG